MEKKFIKYKEGQVNLAKVLKQSSDCAIDDNDVREGRLVIGNSVNGQCLMMGYLKGIERNADELVYEAVNAIEGSSDIIFMRNPYRVSDTGLPCFAATSPEFARTIVGKIIKCNGELAVIFDGSSTVVNVNTICQLTPYFKETK